MFNDSDCCGGDCIINIVSGRGGNMIGPVRPPGGGRQLQPRRRGRPRGRCNNSQQPSTSPSGVSSQSPSSLPSDSPSAKPSSGPSVTPSDIPSVSPSDTPSTPPSVTPSSAPSSEPSVSSAPSNFCVASGLPAPFGPYFSPNKPCGPGCCSGGCRRRTINCS